MRQNFMLNSWRNSIRFLFSGTYILVGKKPDNKGKKEYICNSGQQSLLIKIKKVRKGEKHTVK